MFKREQVPNAVILALTFVVDVFSPVKFTSEIEVLVKLHILPAVTDLAHSTPPALPKSGTKIEIVTGTPLNLLQ